MRFPPTGELKPTTPVPKMVLPNLHFEYPILIENQIFYPRNQFGFNTLVIL